MVFVLRSPGYASWRQVIVIRITNDDMRITQRKSDQWYSYYVARATFRGHTYWPVIVIRITYYVIRITYAIPSYYV